MGYRHQQTQPHIMRLHTSNKMADLFLRYNKMNSSFTSVERECFYKSKIQFPAPMLKSSQPPVSPIPRIWWPLSAPLGTSIYMVHRHPIRNTQMSIHWKHVHYFSQYLKSIFLLLVSIVSIKHECHSDPWMRQPEVWVENKGDRTGTNKEVFNEIKFTK